jgi:hypothetical protein
MSSALRFVKVVDGQEGSTSVKVKSDDERGDESKSESG